ncbi:MAG TPA: CBS domain-containing protein [Polyangiaceae bacterium]
MSNPIPAIKTFMTTAPHSIGKDQTLAQAQAFLQQHQIRHLPVLSGGALVGILTERDLSLIGALGGTDVKKTMVEEVMTTSVYAVTPETQLAQVAATMSEKKYGSAVVMQNGKVVGIFTTVDACRALAELLDSRSAT